MYIRNEIERIIKGNNINRSNCFECSNSNKVYLIKFEALKQQEEKELFEHKYGVFKERNNEAILGPLMDNKFYLFCFSRRNFFEGRLFERLDIAEARREQRYVRQMLSVIDELNLSLDIYR